jgi:hypothetical protein
MDSSNLKEKKTKLGPPKGPTYREQSFLDLANYQIRVTARAEEYIGFSKINNNPIIIEPPAVVGAQITTENGFSLITESGDNLVTE